MGDRTRRFSEGAEGVDPILIPNHAAPNSGCAGFSTHGIFPMNHEEQRLLTEFLDQLKQIKGVAKDPGAETLIRSAAGKQPDALYLLVQKALIQEQALNAARNQITDLKNQIQQRLTAGSGAAKGEFLGHDPWAGSAPRVAATSAPAWPAAAPSPYPTSPFGSFLGSAAATAAGIAGGAFLFHGIESLLGRHDAENGFSDAHSVENSTTHEHGGHDSHLSDSEPSDVYDGDTASDESFESYDDDINSVDV